MAAGRTERAALRAGVPGGSEERRRRARSSHGGAFEVEQEALARQPAGVAGEAPVLADDAVARDDHGERVVRDGIADLAGERGVAELARELPVRRRLPVGNPRDEVPDLPLERGAGHGRRQVEARALPGEVLGELLLDLGEPALGAGT